MSKIVVPALIAALAGAPALAQPRGPVVPNFQEAPKPAPESDLLVGPTAAQQARAKAAADAKARAEADAKAAEEQKARDEAAAKMKAQAEAMAKADAEAKARADAEAKAKEDAALAKRRAVDEAAAKAKAAVDAAKQRALEAELARRRAVEEARAAARAAVEAKKRADQEAAAAAREEARARKAAAEAKAKAKALVVARKREEAKCGRGKKAEKCLAAVAAKYDAPALPAPQMDTMAIAPLVPAPAPAPVAPPPAAAAAKPVMPGAPAPAAGDRRIVVVPTDAPAPVSTASVAKPIPVAPAAPAPVRPASTLVASAQPAAASSVIAVPRDEMQRRPRSAEVVNDLQVGPQSLVLDNLTARGELFPGIVQLSFGYRFTTDDAAAPHHLFMGGLESGACAAGDACGLRWFLRSGISPRAAADYTVDRSINGTKGTHRDTLGWSANLLQAGLGYTGGTLIALADAQLEGLTEEYLRNVDLAGPQRVSGSLKQLRLRGTLGLQGGGFVIQARGATYAYSGDPTDGFKTVPMRGALIEDDVPGLAGALQQFSARGEARWESRGGFAIHASYGYLQYLGPTWSYAHLFEGGLSQRFGRFRIGVGVVGEQEVDAQGNTWPTVFGTGSVGAAF